MLSPDTGPDGAAARAGVVLLACFGAGSREKDAPSFAQLRIVVGVHSNALASRRLILPCWE